MDTIKRLPRFLNVSVDYLLGLTDEKEGPLAEVGKETLEDDALISRVLALRPEDRQKVETLLQWIEEARGGEASPPAKGHR